MLQHIISACRTRQQHWLGFSFAKSNIFPFDGKFLLRRPPVHCSGSQGITNAIPLHVYEQNTMRSTHQGRAMSTLPLTCSNVRLCLSTSARPLRPILVLSCQFLLKSLIQKLQQQLIWIAASFRSFLAYPLQHPLRHVNLNAAGQLIRIYLQKDICKRR